MVMRIMVLVALLGHSSVANSQYGVTYPVDINAMLTPPYGTCLTDYVGTNRFQCNVLMRDMHATGYKFRILMTVKDMASGRVMFSAQSDQHTVTPGKPVYMAEIGVFSEFFKAGNILSSTAYRDGCLNEGAYNFVFQVVDDNDKRRIPISKECVFPARLQAGGAPLLISPFTGTNIDCNQTIVNFSWQMPVVTGEQTKYLIEICPTDEGGNGLHYLGSYTPSANGSGPSQGYIHATSYMPMYQLIETEGMKLVPNTTYFWRVSIIDEFGNVKPNSTSEIDSFTYCYTKELEPYTPLKEPKVKAINGELDTVHIDTVKTEDNATKATWFLDDVRFKYQSYALDIRKKSQDTWTTYHIKINEGDTEEKNYYGLSNLKYNEPYEARMQYLLITDNDTSYAPFSDTITFVVPNPMDTADCGEIMAIKDCNGEKGKILKKYDTLYANGTPVVLDSIIYKAGDSTVISGFGVVSFPILRNFKLKMSFNEVSVNCYGELVSGQVVSVYNESTGAIIDLNHSTGKGDGGGSQSTNERPDPTSYKDENEAKEKMQTGEYAKIGDFIYTKDKDGNVVALGKTLSIPAEKYTNNNTLDDDDVYCIFRNDTKDAPYIGFDADEHKYYRGRPTLGDHYTPTFSKQDGADFEYIIPYVASNPGRVVKLSATLEGRLTDEYDKESLKFIMPMSGGDYLELNAKKEGDKFIVDFPGGKNPDTNSDVYAIVKKGEKYVNVGKINIETYAWRTQKVKIVPVVNDYGVDENAISETLNRIYGRFGITYEVSKDDRFESENINSEFLDNFSVSSGTFTKQSDDMKRLQYYYKTERGIQDSTAYIFLLKSAVDYPTIDGDMPQGQICGYIFMHSDNGTLSDGRLVAHELAHGIYRLDHVFEKAYKIPENSTDNLLDYNNGDQLAHFQWELIKKPGFAWALLESDEENMYVQESNHQEIARFINEVRCAIKKHTEDVNENELYIHFAWHEYVNSKIKDVAKCLGISVNSKIANEKIYVNISNSIIYNRSAVWLGYETVTLDINKIKIDKIRRSITIESAKNNQGSLFFSVDSNDAFDWLLTELGYNRRPVNRNYRNCGLSLDEIMVYSLCDLEKICIDDRIKLIKQVAEKPENMAKFDYDTYQFLCSRLITTTPAKDQKTLYDFFVNNPKLVINCYNKFAKEQKTQFITTLLILWFDMCKNRDDSEKIFIFKKSIFGNLNANTRFRNNKVEVYETVHGSNYDVYGYESTPSYEKIIVEGTLFEPINVGIENRPGEANTGDFGLSKDVLVPLPAICIKFIADNGNWEDLKATGGLIFDVVTTVMGVGEIVVACKMLKASKFIAGSAKLLFELADMGQSSVSTACGLIKYNCDDCGEFCKKWAEYEKYISLGFMSKGIAEKYAEKLQSLYTAKVAERFPPETKNFFENDCGLKPLPQKAVSISNELFMPNVNDWIKTLDPVADKNLINKLDDLGKANSKTISFLEADIKFGGEKAEYIKSELKKDPDLFDKTYVNCEKNGSDYVYEVSKTDEKVKKVMNNATSTFGDAMAKGRKFEQDVCRVELANKESNWYNKLKDLFKKDFQKNLNEYTLFNDVQLYYMHNGKKKYFVADHIFVKLGADGRVDDFVIIEDKLKETTKLSQNQSEAFKCMNFTVRSNNKKSADNTAKLIQGSSISFTGGNAQIYKVFDSDQGKEIEGIKKF